MVPVFWDDEGLVLVDFLPRMGTINGDYYANLVRQLRAAIIEKLRGKIT